MLSVPSLEATMVKRILVPVDGSPASETILRHLRQLLKSVDIDLCLMHACIHATKVKHNGAAYLKELADGLRELFPVVDTELIEGDPAAKIIERAIVGKFDLVALTTRGWSGLQKLLFGSTAQTLMHNCPVPLLVAPPDAVAASFKTILVPLDGSVRAKSILPLAASLAKAAGGRILLMTAGRPVWRLESAREALEGVPVDVVALPGKPAKAILEAAAGEKADLIALSTHGRTGSEKAFFGSVTEAVLHAAHVPLLVKRTAGLLQRALMKAHVTRLPASAKLWKQ